MNDQFNRSALAVASGAMLLVLTSDKCLVNGCTFSQDGRLLASVSNDLTLRTWDVTTGSALSVLRGHEDWINSCAFSHDGSRLATASDDCTLRLWDATTGELRRTYLHPKHASACWLPTGRVLHSTGRAWRYLSYQHQDIDGALQVTPIDECSPWQAG